MIGLCAKQYVSKQTQKTLMRQLLHELSHQDLTLFANVLKFVLIELWVKNASICHLRSITGWFRDFTCILFGLRVKLNSLLNTELSKYLTIDCVLVLNMFASIDIYK